MGAAVTVAGVVATEAVGDDDGAGRREECADCREGGGACRREECADGCEGGGACRRGECADRCEGGGACRRGECADRCEGGGACRRGERADRCEGGGACRRGECACRRDDCVGCCEGVARRREEGAGCGDGADGTARVEVDIPCRERLACLSWGTSDDGRLVGRDFSVGRGMIGAIWCSRDG
jgi:hypothetical protein